MQFQEEFLKRYNYYEVISLLLQNGERVRMNLYGFCMRPFIKNGENVTIKPIKPEELRCGDVIVYQFNDRFKIHRFLKFKTISDTKFIIAKGDRCINIDSPVSLNLLLGKITQVEKSNRTICFESIKWKIINYMVGKTSPYISKIECLIMYVIQFPRKCASRIFRLFFGTSFRIYFSSAWCSSPRRK